MIEAIFWMFSVPPPNSAPVTGLVPPSPTNEAVGVPFQIANALCVRTHRLQLLWREHTPRQSRASEIDDALRRACRVDLACSVAHDHFAQRGLCGDTHDPTGQQCEHGHGQHHRQPNAHIQRQVQKSIRRGCGGHAISLVVWQTRNPRHAPSRCAWGFWRRLRWRRECGPCARRWSGQRLRARAHARPP